MEKPKFIKFEISSELQTKIYNAVEKAAEAGKIKKGTNEVTKIVEKSQAKFVVVSTDVDPPEVIAHIPLLCEEKNIPYGYVSSKNDLGSRIGLKSVASVAIVEFGNSESDFKEIIEEISKIKK